MGGVPPGSMDDLSPRVIDVKADTRLIAIVYRSGDVEIRSDESTVWIVEALRFLAARMEEGVDSE